MAVIGCTTPEWLEEALDDVDIMSGFANRFGYVTGELRPPNPLPGPMGDVTGIRMAVEAASERWAGEEERAIPLNSAARRVWRGFYLDFYERPWPSERIASMVQRVPERVLKVALIYAAVEGTDEITADQLEAAVGVGDYETRCILSLFTVFGHSEDSKLEARIEAFVKKKMEEEPFYATMTQIAQRLSGRVGAERLRRLVDGMVSVGKMEYIDDKHRRVLWCGD